MSADTKALGFTGSQFGCEKPAQIARLRQEFLRLLNAGFQWMHNGDCLGSDHRAAILWESLGGFVHLHPPTNNSRRAFIDADIVSEPRPYLDRNHDIVDNSSLLVATPQEMFEQQRSGTWATTRYARKLGRPVIIIWPDGTVTRERDTDGSPQGPDRNGLDGEAATAWAEGIAR